MTLHIYRICQTCESLLSPDIETCPVCGSSVEANSTLRTFQVLRHRVCNNCKSLAPDDADFCPFCETPLSPLDKNEILEQPEELEILDIEKL